MYAAIVSGNKSKVLKLIENGFDVNHRMRRFMLRTGLHIAADSGQYEIFYLMFSLGANLNQRDESGVVPIFLACSKSSLKIVEFCMDNGAKINMSTARGLTLASYIPRGQEMVFDRLFRKYCSYSVLKNRKVLNYCETV
jgi:ankyrin repeat protein